MLIALISSRRASPAFLRSHCSSPASGIRIGTAAVTTRGLKQGEMQRVAELIDATLAAPDDVTVGERVRADVRELTSAFPLYPAPVETTTS